MGCDLRHVKRVVHAGPPSCMKGLSYIQYLTIFFRDNFYNITFKPFTFHYYSICPRNSRAGRDGSQAEAVLYWNATDLCHDFIDKSFKDFCKSNDICRRVFITNYFNTVYPSSVENCTEHFKTPKLTQRQIMRDSLQAYVSIDTSNSLSEHFIMIITDVFEHLHESKQIQDIFNLPEHVAQTVLNIKHAISAL